jgi:hypothetical protein
VILPQIVIDCFVVLFFDLTDLLGLPLNDSLLDDFVCILI